jgi:hypothetical protein
MYMAYTGIPEMTTKSLRNVCKFAVSENRIPKTNVPTIRRMPLDTATEYELMTR